MIASAVTRERTNVLPGNIRLLTEVRVDGRGPREAVPRLAFASGLIRRKATDRDDSRSSLSVQMRYAEVVPATARAARNLARLSRRTGSDRSREVPSRPYRPGCASNYAGRIG